MKVNYPSARSLNGRLVAFNHDTPPSFAEGGFGDSVMENI